MSGRNALVIEADEVAFGQGKTLTEELLKAQVSFEVIPRGLVLREGKLVGVFGLAHKGEGCKFAQCY